MEPLKISALILTLNEESNIKRCLNSLRSFADEILVVDSFSTDRTGDFCKEAGAHFIQNKFEGFVEQITFASNRAQYPYQFIIDADEDVSLELQQSLMDVKKNWRHDAYSFNRMANYCGKWIKHCGWYPDKKTRLIDFRKGNWGGENPHHRFILNNPTNVGHLHGDVLHYAFNTIVEHVDTTNKYSSIAAKELIKKNKKIFILYHLILNPIFTFVNKYLFRMGLLDGYYGFVICTLSATANFLKYAKVISLRKLEKK